MILDSGMAEFYRKIDNAKTGNMYSGELSKYHVAWFGWRTVGYNRFYTARQANTQIDSIIRILRPSTAILADDVVRIKEFDSTVEYRITQIQNIRDEESGENVCDITLTRVGDKLDSNSNS